MKSLMIKTNCDMHTVRTTLGDPRATPGDNRDCSLQLRRINNIPDDVSPDRVLRLFEYTADCTAYTQSGARFEFDYSELGIGTIIR
jgi:hypothetical protein